MRHFATPAFSLMTACLLVLSDSGAAPAVQSRPPAATAKAFPFPVHEKTLANGLRMVVVSYDSPGLVAYYSIVRTGSRNEVEPGKTGFAHFFEHMMFHGTEKVSQEQYSAVIKS